MLSKMSIMTVMMLATLAAVGAFSPQSVKPRTHSVLSAVDDRRSFLAAGGSAALSFLASAQSASAVQEQELRQGIEVNSFNGLAYNYRGGEFGGLDASMLDEPSVSYADFNVKLKTGEVAFVEFVAPDGDKAYATFKAKEGEAAPAPIRIGEGYPIEQHDGYSSPMFCIRSVKNAGVPYKFTVPGLSKYSN
jgi:hypothetical protein